MIHDARVLLVPRYLLKPLLVGVFVGRNVALVALALSVNVVGVDSIQHVDGQGVRVVAHGALGINVALVIKNKVSFGAKQLVLFVLKHQRVVSQIILSDQNPISYHDSNQIDVVD